MQYCASPVKLCFKHTCSINLKRSYSILFTKTIHSVVICFSLLGHKDYKGELPTDSRLYAEDEIKTHLPHCHYCCIYNIKIKI